MAPRMFPTLTASTTQATTYLLGVALFSISFLVFLNSSISFVVTEVIGRKERVGDAVGTLGFADELVALVACPLWGLLSDRIGVRTVAVAGYCIVALSLACLVQSTNVYPQLLLGRMGFSVGAAACTTMVTAVLPSMVAEKGSNGRLDEENGTGRRRTPRLRDNRNRDSSLSHATSASVNSELTITPTRYASRDRNAPSYSPGTHEEVDSAAGTSQLAGLVGFFTGGGALLALAFFLPLPAYLQNDGFGRSESVQISFYIVAAVAVCVSVFVFFGLRHLPGEDHKSFAALLRTPYDETTTIGADGNPHITLSPAPSYLALAREALVLGFTDPAIGLGYLGGFVARASSVGISLFIPLFVNAYFVRTGLCTSNPDNLTDIKENCERAYKLAAALTGIGELAALLSAPLFGWLGGRAAKGKSEWPLLVATLFGIVGYTGIGFLKNPDAFHGDGGRWALLAVIFIGISQIGSIVCSLGLLGRAVNQDAETPRPMKRARSGTLRQEDVGPISGGETTALLPGAQSSDATGKLDRSRLKGSIAGMYSLAGGAGILLLTKLGGKLFDRSAGAPFFLLAIFNGVLLVAIILVGGGKALWRTHNAKMPSRGA